MAPFDFAPLTRRYAQDERKRGRASFDFARLARRGAERERKRNGAIRMAPFISTAPSHRPSPQIIPIPLSTDSMIAAAMTEPIWPPALALMACISRWFFLL